jgi:hypothetical protein
MGNFQADFYATGLGGGSGNGVWNYPMAEYAWVCAPNATSQTLSANTLTTLTLTHEVRDDDGIGSLSDNQITLAAGRYVFDLYVPISYPTTSASIENIMALYNTGGTDYIWRRVKPVYFNSNGGGYDREHCSGDIKLSTSSTLEIRCGSKTSGYVKSTFNNESFTLATANLDQRTTITLWKVA